MQGWSGTVDVEKLAGKKITVVPILRAGIGMLDGVLTLVPGAKVSVVGLARNEETLQAHTYLERLVAELDQRVALIGTPCWRPAGRCAPPSICSSAPVAAISARWCWWPRPKESRALDREHPDVQVYTASIDQGLNQDGYIIPGLGDAGDRIFGTRQTAE